MNPLAGPYVRIALGAAASSYLAPKVINRFVRVEMTELDERINNASAIGITAGVTTLVFVVTGMIFGGKTAKAAADVPGVGGGK